MMNSWDDMPIWATCQSPPSAEGCATMEHDSDNERSLTAQRRKRERLLTLMGEIQRRQSDDPLRHFDLHNKQKPFVEAVLHGPTSENWFIAANRSGKSDAGAYAGATLARFGDQGDDVRFVGAQGSNVTVRDRSTSGWVSALDFPTSRDTIQPKYFDNGFLPPGASHPPFIPDREIEEWRVADQILKLKVGSIIGFKSADSGRSKYQGAEKDWVHLDEEHPNEVYNEISIRVGARRLRIFNTCTLLPPVGQTGGITWVFPRVIEPFMRGELTNVGVFGSSIYDNPHIPVEEIEILESKFPPTSVEGRIRLGGEWLPGLSGARAYTAFDRRLNVRTQPLINLRRPLAWIWDFNVEPLVSLLGQRETFANGKNMFRIYRELGLEGSASIPEMCQLFYEVHPKHFAEIWIYGDATGRHRHPQSNKSNYTMILNEMRHYQVPFRMKVPESNPPVPDRINAVNHVMRDEDGMNRFECSPSCIELIADFEQVLRDNRGGIKKVTNPKDAYFKRTHYSDAVGYWIAFDEPVRTLVRESRAKIKLNSPVYSFSNRR
jgi:phage terminase large subunit-like protein